MRKRQIGIVILLTLSLIAAVVPQISAKSELAAILEVLSPGVEVLRAGTVNWISVNVEAIVGVGDLIRTDESGQARVTFFADGVDTEIHPSTEYRIKTFEGEAEAFTILAEVLFGQTTQRINRLLGASSTYDITTPGMTLAARGTQFAIRVEDDGRAAMLVSEGNVDATNDSGTSGVPAEFGIRAEKGGDLSDVVRASSFDELDSALDGCEATVVVPGDVQLNVRTGPGTDFPRVGTVDPAELSLFMGVDEGGDWYRIPFRGGFGWIFSSEAQITGECPNLRLFEDNTVNEDPALYESLGEEIQLEDLTPRTPVETEETTES